MYVYIYIYVCIYIDKYIYTPILEIGGAKAAPQQFNKDMYMYIQLIWNHMLDPGGW